MTDAALPVARPRRGNFSPRIVGSATVIAALLAAEVLIQRGVVNRFIVPPPSEVIEAFSRIVAEEHVFRRFFATATECLIAGVMLTVIGVGAGVLINRFKLLQQAIENWVASLAAA